MTCVCGEENPDGALFCRHCLELYLEVDDRQPLQGNEHLLVLLEACEQLARGDATAEEFTDFLDQFTLELGQREAGIHAVEIPPYLEADFAEERETGLQGVERCNEGLHMLRGLAEGDLLTMGAALARFYEGFRLVTEAMEINRRNRNRPIWG
jgi:hypothetical protein